jgi:hypothetical protein
LFGDFSFSFFLGVFAPTVPLTSVAAITLNVTVQALACRSLLW